MSRPLKADHAQMFAVFAGDAELARQVHSEFTNWLALQDFSGELPLRSSTAVSVKAPEGVAPPTRANGKTSG